MGMTVEMVDKKGPHFPEPLESPEDGQYERVLNKKVDVAAELDYVYKAITLTRHKLKGRVPLFGFCGAPWTLLCYMVEGGGSKLFVKTKTWVYRYPEASKALLQKIAEVCVEYLALQVKAGAQVSSLATHECTWSKLMVISVDSSFRLVGCGIIPVFFQGVLTTISCLYIGKSTKTPQGARSRASPNGCICKGSLVCLRFLV